MLRRADPSERPPRRVLAHERLGSVDRAMQNDAGLARRVQTPCMAPVWLDPWCRRFFREGRRMIAERLARGRTPAYGRSPAMMYTRLIGGASGARAHRAAAHGDGEGRNRRAGTRVQGKREPRQGAERHQEHAVGVSPGAAAPRIRRWPAGSRSGCARPRGTAALADAGRAPRIDVTAMGPTKHGHPSLGCIEVLLYIRPDARIMPEAYCSSLMRRMSRTFHSGAEVGRFLTTLLEQPGAGSPPVLAILREAGLAIAGGIDGSAEPVHPGDA